MCQPDAFAGHPGLRHLRRYYVQDIFGGYERVRATGLPAVMPVAPIVDLREAPYDMAGARAVFHLGGIVNPFPSSAVSPYPAGIAALIRSLARSERARPDQRRGQAAIRRSPGRAARGVAEPRAGDQRVPAGRGHLHLPGTHLPARGRVAGTAGRSAAAGELLAGRQHAAADRRVRPVAGEAWHFLARAYAGVGTDVAESLGVQQVTEVNRHLLPAARFQRDYLDVARSAARAGALLPAGARRAPQRRGRDRGRHRAALRLSRGQLAQALRP